jgi:sugar phosphate isomerase/epimerase
MNNIFISTFALKYLSIEEIIQVATQKKWNIEFSSGLPFNESMEDIYINSNINRIPHNYFPSPFKPFVLNLASSSEEIRTKSIEHCKNGLILAKTSNSPFFSAHAGFCIDPKPEELGKKLDTSNDFDKNKHIELFMRSLEEILDFASILELDFLIENNVIASFNMFGDKNPLLCCDSDEILKIHKMINHTRFSFLLDTGHLKVSSTTLGKNCNYEFHAVRKYIKAIHHSDNDGKVDSNNKLDHNYWFSNYIPELKHLVHVLEVSTNTIGEVESQLNYLKKWM